MTSLRATFVRHWIDGDRRPFRQRWPLAIAMCALFACTLAVFFQLVSNHYVAIVGAAAAWGIELGLVDFVRARRQR